MSTKHNLLALVVVVVWGLNFVVIDEGLVGVPPLVFLALRFLLVAVPAVFFIRPPSTSLRNVVVIGAFLSFGQFALLYLALHLGMPSGLASLLMQTQVVLSVLFSALILGERPTPKQLIGITVGMIGLAAVVLGHTSSAPWLPVVVTLLAASAWAIGNVFTRRAGVASGLSIVVWSALVVPIPAIALAALVDGPELVLHSLATLSGTAIASTLYTAVAASLIGYGIWNTLLSRYPTSAVTPFTLLVPVIGILVAWLLQNERPSVTELVGGAVMLAGLGIAVIRRRGADARAGRDLRDSGACEPPSPASSGPAPS